MQNSNRSGLSHRKWRVGINAQLISEEAGYRQAGIHTYLLQTVAHLPREEDTSTYLIYTQTNTAVLQRPDMQIETSRLPLQRRLLRIGWEQLLLPLHAARQQLDLLHCTAFVRPLLLSCPAIVTVYDLSFIYFAQTLPRLQQRYLSSQTARSCRQAARVITISESSRQDVHRLFAVPLSKIDVVRPGVDAAFRPLPAAEVAAFRQQKGLPDRFVLHVGTLQPRKNIPLLLAAYAQVAPVDVSLVLVGGKGWLYDEIFQRVAALGLQERVIFAGYVPRDELPFWYSAAELFAFPSLYEGFGIPVVEAMACGTPVIAADVSSIPEAGGTAALYFAPNDIQACAKQLANVLQDPALAATMRTKGLAQAKKFSWQRAGAETAAVYKKVLP